MNGSVDLAEAFIRERPRVKRVLELLKDGGGIPGHGLIGGRQRLGGAVQVKVGPRERCVKGDRHWSLATNNRLGKGQGPLWLAEFQIDEGEVPREKVGQIGRADSPCDGESAAICIDGRTEPPKGLLERQAKRVVRLTGGPSASPSASWIASARS